ncbi:PREDICTED: protein HID1-like [Acropora digitifera]|uniref:protein HID1-like n=1 Tax=Acropora digitifera TaxID=70779 RepID=UPI00077B10E0|nr:PREDICTED: protein HID1-like [Acropora digitifera]
MGGSDSKLNFRKAVVQLTTKKTAVEATDETFWDQFWSESSANISDVFTLIPASEIRALRDENPSNLATLCYKCVEKLHNATLTGCSGPSEQLCVLNCVRLLTRFVPYIFEDPDWRGFFWSTVPGQDEESFGEGEGEEARPPLAQTLLGSLADLCFCPDFTVHPPKKTGPDQPEDLSAIDSCEYIWSQRLNSKVLILSSFCNRHALPIFTSLLNLVCSYDPVGYGVPWLDFLDFYFILHGIANLLNNPLIQTYLPNSCKKVSFHQELLVLFWKMCDQNKKFLFYVLKSSDVLDILVPILYHLNDARSDQSRLGLMHIGVFILLLLSGERNFGVRLNKPYSVRVPMDIPVFTGTHADFLVIVFHKIITNGHQRLQPLFDCLLTIIVNVSPYLKSLSMVAANKLLHLLEAFSTPWFLFSNATNHHLVFFLLEIFNNIIQYQFDGNSHLVYAIIRKRNIFHQLANLPTDPATVQKPRRRIASQGSEKDAPASSSGGEDKTPVAAASSSGRSMPEMSADMSVKEVRNPASESEFSDVEARSTGDATPPSTPGSARTEKKAIGRSSSVTSSGPFVATPEWVQSWKQKLPLQTIMRMLQVLVPQVEKICIDKGLTDESEIIKFLQHGTLVGLLPVPHPILIRKYQANSGTQMWFRTYMWGIIYLRNIDPPIWYDTDVKLFEIQRV